MSLIVEACDVSKRFYLRHNPSGHLKVRILSLLDARHRERVEEFWALKQVWMQIRAGESVGLIGRNGSGKSTFLKLLAGIHRPTQGTLRIADGARIGTLIELGVGFHPELTGRENVLLNAAIHGLSRPELEAIYERVIEYSGLRHFMDVALKNYSSGMHMRLGFAVAANLDPDLLLLDEVFAVGDEDFRRRCVGTIREFQGRGKTILFVSHTASAIEAMCNRTCVLDRGRLVFDGDVDSGLREYQRLNMAAGMEVNRAAGGPDSTPASRDDAGGPARQTGPRVSEAELDLEWHRLARGARWREEGQWAAEFLRRRGLQPQHYLLDLGCGSLATAVHLLPYLRDGHYCGFDTNGALVAAGLQIELPRADLRAEQGRFIVNDGFDLTSAAKPFDLAIASSYFPRLTLNRIGRCIAIVLKKLQPGASFYATWFEDPYPDRFEPVTRPDGTTTYPDAEPYHYSLALLTGLCEAVGAHAERVADTGHPTGQSVIRITRSHGTG